MYDDVPPPHEEPPRMTNPTVYIKKQNGFWSCMTALGFGCFLTMLAIIVLIILFCKACSSALEDDFEFESDSCAKTTYMQGDGDSKKLIAVLKIQGIILSSEDGFSSENCPADKTCKLIREIAEDPDVKAIILYLDTPGGEVTASDLIYHELKNCGKPVIAYMNSMAASGGYYISAAASKIVAHRMTMTGSIGVILHTTNYAGLFQKIGLKDEVYASGKMKDMLNGARERTPEETALAQQLVKNTYLDFVRIVSEARKIPEQTILTTEIGDGRILDGVQAQKAGLVDQTGYFEDAVKLAEKEAGLKEDSAQVLLYEYNDNLFACFAKMMKSTVSPRMVLPGQNASRTFTPDPGKAYFLPAGY